MPFPVRNPPVLPPPPCQLSIDFPQALLDEILAYLWATEYNRKGGRNWGCDWKRLQDVGRLALTCTWMAGVCQPKVKHLGFGYWFDGIDWPKKLSSETLAGLFQCWPAVKTLEIYHRPFLQPLSVVIEQGHCSNIVSLYLEFFEVISPRYDNENWSESGEEEEEEDYDEEILDRTSPINFLRTALQANSLPQLERLEIDFPELYTENKDLPIFAEIIESLRGPSSPRLRYLRFRPFSGGNNVRAYATMLRKRRAAGCRGLATFPSSLWWRFTDPLST